MLRSLVGSEMCIRDSSIRLLTAPSGLTGSMQDLFLRIDSKADDSELPSGNYLIDYTAEVVNAVLEHRFSNIRPIGQDMITADAIDFVNAGTITNMAYEVFEDMSRGVFVIEDTADGVDILRIEVDRDIVDFAHVPTVNGCLLYTSPSPRDS